MSTPLAKKVEGKNFMWDGGTYDDSADQAGHGGLRQGGV